MLHNFSAWQASTFSGWLEDSTEGQIVLVKQSYEFDEQGNVTAIEPGPEIIIADDYQDEPNNSPLCEVNEQVAFKHGFEVYGNCTAYPPKGKDARVIEVELGLDSPSQPLFKKRLRVTGARHWRAPLCRYYRWGTRPHWRRTRRCCHRVVRDNAPCKRK